MKILRIVRNKPISDGHPANPKAFDKEAYLLLALSDNDSLSILRREVLATTNVKFVQMSLDGRTQPIQTRWMS